MANEGSDFALLNELRRLAGTMRYTSLGESVGSRKPVGEGGKIFWEEKFAEGPPWVP